MFISRLNGEPIGFSVLRIFIVDKNTILTVIVMPVRDYSVSSIEYTRNHNLQSFRFLQLLTVIRSD